MAAYIWVMTFNVTAGSYDQFMGRFSGPLAVQFARLVGGMLGSLGGAAVIHAGSAAFLAVLVASMVFTFLGVAIVRRHYPARTIA